MAKELEEKIERTKRVIHQFQRGLITYEEFVERVNMIEKTNFSKTEKE